MGTFQAIKSIRINQKDDIQSLLFKFSPELKQAIYAASHNLEMAKGTWDGCVMNAAGNLISGGSVKVNSTSRASQVFGVNSALVQQFINLWDSSALTTTELREMVLKTGLFKPAAKRTVFSVVTHDNERDADKRKFESIMEQEDFELPNVNIDELTCLLQEGFSKRELVSA